MNRSTGEEGSRNSAVPDQERRNVLKGVLAAGAALGTGILTNATEAEGQACVVNSPPYPDTPVVRRCVSFAEARALLDQVADPNRVMVLASFLADNPSVCAAIDVVVMP